MSDYRLVYERTVGWVVQRRTVKPEFKKDGSPNPEAGQEEWSAHKFPGRDLSRAAYTLINEEMDESVVTSYEEWVQAYDAAAERVMAALHEWAKPEGGYRDIH